MELRSIDIRTGKWYSVEAKHGTTTLTCLEERLERAEPVVMAYDIETTKLPLKFPDAAIAFDLGVDQSAGQTVELVGAALGTA